jgi:hypothetical protein
VYGITTELWKKGSRKLKIRLLQMFNEIWNEGRTPEEGKRQKSSISIRKQN